MLLDEPLKVPDAFVNHSASSADGHYTAPLQGTLLLPMGSLGWKLRRLRGMLCMGSVIQGKSTHLSHRQTKMRPKEKVYKTVANH
jgi:hypothetical protein